MYFKKSPVGKAQTVLPTASTDPVFLSLCLIRIGIALDAKLPPHPAAAVPRTQCNRPGRPSLPLLPTLSHLGPNLIPT